MAIFNQKSNLVKINNKIYLLFYVIGFILPVIVISIITKRIEITDCLYMLGMLLTIPYFYNYYNLMKGEK